MIIKITALFHQAEKAVLAEEARLADYLHPTSVAPLLDTVLAELIEGPLDELLCKDTGIEYLLDKRNPEGPLVFFGKYLISMSTDFRFAPSFLSY